MDITLLNGISGLNAYSTENTGVEKTGRNNTFDSMFKSALSMLNETNDLSNAAKEAEVSYALGLSDNTYDLQVAQEKANASLQYTVQVRNKVLDAYKEIMNLQF
ncbi:flagellar hook-basal body complex protein FliE [Anaerocolumna jejuensis DSM 15929]|uniref:Flagellar hook-basal body complex protein FliE n=1 Tax=Anaerocolumna jejuensis DSM 15929 TaxID=1121322 RepID=A0A1M6NGI6_9FIRM|nr:flagellar hook-basal body complex protein FliE [Anaerocolumna jejuensis]SHJ94723.1 flagellar hook-basal body complex protein FliE [Anaerocolumna jejuensis DSM 15929]